MTANELITRSLKTIGVLASGETADSGSVSDALVVLNNMVDSWATNRLTIYAVIRNVLDLSASTQEYTIGTGGTFAIVRPVWIARGSLILDRNASAAEKIELPVSGPVTVQEWQRVAIKGTTSTYPTLFYYDKAWTAGLAKVSVWPIPDNSNVQLVLYVPTALTQFADLTTAYTFPPGYEEALRYQLALRLAQEFGAVVSGGLLELARESFADIKRVNLSKATLGIDPALTAQGGRYNWRTDQFA
jgi:hypothetical protein|tara:strand:- start:2510 stop:3244 length:735 start_codon:yes stop_codon:yes gene_type:complete